jgi:hypothetical protein
VSLSPLPLLLLVVRLSLGASVVSTLRPPDKTRLTRRPLSLVPCATCSACLLAPRACPRPIASPPVPPVPGPPRPRAALLSPNAAPCALLRPPSAPGCSSHSVRTASYSHLTHKAGRRIDPQQGCSFCWAAPRRPLRSRASTSLLRSQPYLQSVAEPRGLSTHRHRSAVALLRASPCSPVLLPCPLCCSCRSASPYGSGDDIAHDRPSATGRCMRGCSSPRVVRRCLFCGCCAGASWSVGS